MVPSTAWIFRFTHAWFLAGVGAFDVGETTDTQATSLIALPLSLYAGGCTKKKQLDYIAFSVKGDGGEVLDVPWPVAGCWMAFATSTQIFWQVSHLGIGGFQHREQLRFLEHSSV